MTGRQKAEPFLVLMSVGIGMGLAQVPGLADWAAGLIGPLLALMLYATFLPLPFTNLGRIGQQSRVVLASLAINFIWTPLFAWGLGALFLQPFPDLRVGLLMLMVTPCTDWYLVFTNLAKGDVGLGLALLPCNLLLQVGLLPIYLLIFARMLVDVNPFSLFRDVLWVLVLPGALAGLSHLLLAKQGKGSLQRLSANLSDLQTVSLNLAIIAIFTSQGEVLLHYPSLFLRLLVPIVLFFFVNFLLAYQMASWLQFSYEELACFSCTTLARNSPLSLAIATAIFPDRTFIILALVLGPLIELPIMLLISQLLLQIRQRYS